MVQCPLSSRWDCIFLIIAMINGVLSVYSAEKSTAIFSHIDGAELLQSAKRKWTPTDEYILRTFNDQTHVGQLVGAHNRLSRSVFLVHSHCRGNSCLCELVANKFLCEEFRGGIDGFLDEQDSLLREHVSSPFVLVLVEGSAHTVISNLSHGDYVRTVFSPGTYYLTYALLFPPFRNKPNLVRRCIAQRLCLQSLQSDSRRNQLFSVVMADR